MKRFTVLCLAICFVFVPVAAAQKKIKAKPFTTSGYFNGIEVMKESGEASGMAVFLTESDGQLYALMIYAAEDFFRPLLVEAKVSGKDMRTIEFTLPEESPYGGGKYTGVVSANLLNLSEKSGKWTLKRECRYLYSNLSMGSGGDYAGMEVFYSDQIPGYALLTIAEGVLQRPVLVETEPQYNDASKLESFTFTLPGDNGGRKFTGKFTKNGLTLSEAGTSVVLKSKCYK